MLESTPGAVGSPTSPASATTASLWMALDLPAPESATSQHQSSRVVLLGRPLSGKRTLCRRLCLAAETQFPSTRSTEDGTAGGGGGGGPARGSTAVMQSAEGVGAIRRALYNPNANQGDDDIVDDINDLNDEWDTQRMGTPTATRRATDNHSRDLPHGAGVVHDYVVQRIPTRASGDSGFTRGGVAKRTIEFFCCDTAGALSAALPTPQSLEEAVVLLVVDVSQPGSIREQLDRQYDILQSHVTSVLQTFLPSQDEVRRIKLMEVQQQHWLDEEQRHLPLRVKLAAKASDTFVGTSGVKIAEVNKTVLRLPVSTVCPMKSVIVCTKTDVLDKVGRMYDATIAQRSSEELPKEVDDIVPLALRNNVKHHHMNLLPYVAQLVRQYAVVHRSALVAVSSRVSTTATDSAGESALVHPFYRGVWSYLSERLSTCEREPARRGASSASQADMSSVTMPPEVLNLCTANFFPTAFLPSGLDTLAVLHPAIASQSVTLPLLPARTAGTGEVENMSPASPLESSGRGPLDGVFTLHHNYLQQFIVFPSTDRSISLGTGRGAAAPSVASGTEAVTTEDSAWTL